MLTSKLYEYVTSNKSPLQSELFQLEPRLNLRRLEKHDDQILICMDEIHLESEAFQLRNIISSTDFYGSKGHVDKLAKELKSAQHHLEPVILSRLHVPSQAAQRLVLIDGYHRFNAYRAKGRTEIPAFIIHADPMEAALQSVLVNSRNTLNMSSAEKLEAYWTVFLIMTDKPGQTSILKKIGCSNGTLQNFRVAFKELRKDKSLEEVLEYTWAEAKRERLSENSFQFDEHALVREWAEQLFKQFGHKGKHAPQVFGEAVELYMGEQNFDALINYNIDRKYDFEDVGGSDVLCRVNYDDF